MARSMKLSKSLYPAILCLLLLAPASSAYSGVSPVFANAADFDGDGKPDLVVSCHSVNRIMFLKGLGGRKFARPSGVLCSEQPDRLIVAELNGDRYPDLLALENSSVEVFQGSSDGLKPLRKFATGNTVSTGLRRLGENRLVVTNYMDKEVRLMDLKGQSEAILEAPVDPWEAACADFDGDGREDIFCALYGSIKSALWLQHRTNAFTLKKLMLPAPVGYVAVGDLNGDAKPDLALAGSQLVLLTNQGGGQFSSQVFDLGKGAIGQYVACRDVDGDGQAEVAVADLGRNSLAYWHKGQLTSMACGAGPWSAEMADADGDGRPDVLAPLVRESTLLLFWGQPDGTISQPEAFVVDPNRPGMH